MTKKPAQEKEKDDVIIIELHIEQDLVSQIDTALKIIGIENPSEYIEGFIRLAIKEKLKTFFEKYKNIIDSMGVNK